MKLKERISHFWNDTLGVDCPEEVNIEDENLKASFKRVKDLEEKYKYTASDSSSSKGGKRNSGKGIVESVKVNPVEAARQAKQNTVGTKTVEGGEER